MNGNNIYSYILDNLLHFEQPVLIAYTACTNHRPLVAFQNVLLIRFFLQSLKHIYKSIMLAGFCQISLLLLFVLITTKCVTLLTCWCYILLLLQSTYQSLTSRVYTVHSHPHVTRILNVDRHPLMISCGQRLNFILSNIGVLYATDFVINDFNSMSDQHCLQDM